MKLGLGTVQFGLDYGISNQVGKTSKNEAVKILELAEVAGMRMLDTAANYGNSEETLGNCLNTNHPFNIITKLPPTGTEIGKSRKIFEDSLRKLKQSSIYSLMLHQGNDLLKDNGDELYHFLNELKKMGKIQKIGISVYSKQDIGEITSKYDVDLIQGPINIFDQRIIKNNYLKNLKEEKNIEFHARSIFLQGLLLMQPDKLPDYFNPIKDHFEKFHSFLLENSLSPIEAAISFAKNLNEIDSAVIGVNNSKQLNEILAAHSVSKDVNLKQFALDDDNYLNPSKWK